MVFPFLAVVHLILGVNYLFWRLTAGRGDPQLWSDLVFAAEAFVWTAAVGWSLSCLGQQPLQRHPELSVEAPVDVWVLRRRDSLPTLEQTLKAIRALEYPAAAMTVGVLDVQEEDPAVAEFVQTYAVGYRVCSGIRDPWDMALSCSTSPYLFFLEPGHLPDPSVLREAIHVLTANPGVAYTQAQVRGLGQPHVIHPLQHITVVGRDGRGVAPLLGTGCVIRRQALMALQGSLDSRQPVSLGSRLHYLGWTGELLSSQVVGALLPLRNRRVALLAILNALRVNPIFAGRASQQQRFQYLWLGLWSLSGLAILIYLLVPVLYFIWGIAPVPDFGRDYFLRFLPYLLLGRLTWIAAFWGIWGQAWQAERQMGSQFFQSLQATGQWLLGQSGYRERPSQWSIWSQVVMTLLLLTGIVVGCLRFAADWEITWGALIFALLWSLYGLAMVTARPPGVWQGE